MEKVSFNGLIEAAVEQPEGSRNYELPDRFDQWSAQIVEDGVNRRLAGSATVAVGIVNPAAVPIVVSVAKRMNKKVENIDQLIRAALEQDGNTTGTYLIPSYFSDEDAIMVEVVVNARLAEAYSDQRISIVFVDEQVQPNQVRVSKNDLVVREELYLNRLKGKASFEDQTYRAVKYLLNDGTVQFGGSAPANYINRSESSVYPSGYVTPWVKYMPVMRA